MPPLLQHLFEKFSFNVPFGSCFGSKVDGRQAKEFPFTEDSGIELANHVKWLEKRRKKESYLAKEPLLDQFVESRP
eukprot:scaffold26125_cov162-Cylindrotheca_fusiformis.AAC.2